MCQWAMVAEGFALLVLVVMVNQVAGTNQLPKQEYLQSLLVTFPHFRNSLVYVH